MKATPAAVGGFVLGGAILAVVAVLFFGGTSWKGSRLAWNWSRAAEAGPDRPRATMAAIGNANRDMAFLPGNR